MYERWSSIVRLLRQLMTHHSTPTSLCPEIRLAPHASLSPSSATSRPSMRALPDTQPICVRPWMLQMAASPIRAIGLPSIRALDAPSRTRPPWLWLSPSRIIFRVTNASFFSSAKQSRVELQLVGILHPKLVRLAIWHPIGLAKNIGLTLYFPPILQADRIVTPHHRMRTPCVGYDQSPILLA